MVELTSAVTTTLIGMMGVVVGAAISNYVNQRIAAKSARRDLLFKKKVDYFDRIVACIEHNLKLYTIWKRKMETKASLTSIDQALKALKKNRARFDISTSALYLDVSVFSHDIKRFVALEKQIFALFERLKNEDLEIILDTLRQTVHALEQTGNVIIKKMRRELTRS